MSSTTPLFTQVNPAELDTDRLGRRGRVSYPIIKGFMEAGIKMAKINEDAINKDQQYLRSVLNSYIQRHDLPIKVFSAAGDLHLMRLDLNNDGTPNPDYVKGMKTTEGNAGAEQHMEAVPLNATEVAKRFELEKGQAQK